MLFDFIYPVLGFIKLTMEKKEKMKINQLAIEQKKNKKQIDYELFD